MPRPSKPKPYGYGRVQFLADLPAIRDELHQGITLTAVYAKRATRLGITYSGFAKLVARYAADARPKQLTLDLDPTHERKTPATTTPRHEHSGTVDAALLRKLTRGS